MKTEEPYQDYYKTLGVSKEDDFMKIRYNYIKRVMLCHPENNPEKMDTFFQLNEAFYILSHVEYRGIYNEMIENDEGRRTDYFTKEIKKWRKKSNKRSRKAAKKPALDFFQEIPKQEQNEKFTLLIIFDTIVSFFSHH
jgi:curved DNA-binding protein CbpA